MLRIARRKFASAHGCWRARNLAWPEAEEHIYFDGRRCQQQQYEPREYIKKCQLSNAVLTRYGMLAVSV